MGFAVAGGLVLSMGNLATQYAWPFVGLSITEVVSSSITVVAGTPFPNPSLSRARVLLHVRCDFRLSQVKSPDEIQRLILILQSRESLRSETDRAQSHWWVAGTTLNYFLDNRINRAEILFPGVGCFLIAVCLGSWLHKSYSRDNLAKLQAHSKCVLYLQLHDNIIKLSRIKDHGNRKHQLLTSSSKLLFHLTRADLVASPNVAIVVWLHRMGSEAKPDPESLSLTPGNPPTSISPR